MFSTRLSEVTADQIREVIETETPESLDFELKRAFSTENGEPDPWMSGGRIGEAAKAELTNEMVAFANTIGGTLIIGIDEDPQTKSARPPIHPIPRCKAAAANLHQAVSARVEPRIPVFECEGIVTEADGTSGVIAMRVLESYLAPHRNTRDNHCYTRRHDRAEPLSMLEIQELTRRVAQSEEVIEKALSDSSDAFFRWLPEGVSEHACPRGLQGNTTRQAGNTVYTGYWAIRITAVPVRPLPLGMLLRQPWLNAVRKENFVGPGRQGELIAYDVDVMRPWVPRLRAVQRDFHGVWLRGVDRISAAGQVERYLLVRQTAGGARPEFLTLQLHQVVWSVASIIRMADIVRAYSDRPTQDFALAGC